MWLIAQLLKLPDGFSIHALLRVDDAEGKEKFGRVGFQRVCPLNLNQRVVILVGKVVSESGIHKGTARDGVEFEIPLHLYNRLSQPAHSRKVKGVHGMGRCRVRIKLKRS